MAHVLPQECPTCGKDRDTCGGHPGHATGRLALTGTLHHFDFAEALRGFRSGGISAITGWRLAPFPRRHRVFVDVETTGLDEEVHQAFEVAWALETGPVHSFTVPHDIDGADPYALEVNHYHERFHQLQDNYAGHFGWSALDAVLEGAQVHGSNPDFDVRMLYRTFDRFGWDRPGIYYRTVDVCTYAAGALGVDPAGLDKMTDLFGTDKQDHTAAGDVHAARELWRKARSLDRSGVSL